MPTPHSLDADARALLFLDARSNVNFADRPVHADVVREVWELVKWGPTGNNTVPLRLLVAESEQARATVIGHALDGNRAKLANAPLLVVAAHDERFHDTFDITGAGTASTYERLEADAGRRSSMAHSGAMLQAGYFIVGLRAAGLAVRPYGGFDKAGMDAALFDGMSWRSEVLFGIGYPDVEDHGAGERRGRLGADQAVRVA
ncbi:malonic semialdehyde reductase [Demequina aestuarii]|uniref:malonic semialdehyde reductase n=1 Tax=Demequina aestuarii TaxID=327095 RepID=UPI000784EDAB|nr:malonic semialdehyde reductase [Demequina aestuarii]